MIQYEVGKKFPLPNTANGQERCLAEVVGDFFDIRYYIQDPTERDILCWRKEALQYGVFTNSDIPFFILDFPIQNWNFDATINIHKIKNKNDRDSWLNSKANAITLFLINTRTNVLEAQRMIGVDHDLSQKLKETLKEQAKNYTTAGEVDISIVKICNKLTTAQMMKATQMIPLSPGNES